MPAKAYSTKGLQIWFGDAAEPTALVPTAISSAKPASVTVANTAADGDVVYVANSGFPELDGKYFPVGGASATEFDLVGSDTTGTSGALATEPSVELHAKGAAFDLSCLAKTIVFNSSAPAAIPAGTYCDPSLAIASPVLPPTTIEFGGNINIADPAYGELLAATEDGAQRVVDIVLPFAQGDILAPATASLVTWDLPVDGVQGFTATVTCASAPKHRF
jgi:hypothetical protein